MTRSYWLAVAAYLVPTFPLGYVWHLVTFHEAYAKLEIYRDDVVIPLGLSSMLLQAVLYAWVYPRIAPTARDAWRAGALRFFVVSAVLAWSYTTLPVAAKFRMSSVADFVRLETMFTLVQHAIVARLIALAWRDRRA